MQYCLDNANVETIKKVLEYYPIRQFSMNPSVAKRDLKGNGKTFYESLQEISALIGDDATFYVQTVGDTAEEIIKDAKTIRKYVSVRDLHVKICATMEGYKAMKALKAEGYTVTATAVASVTQMLLCLAAGADNIAVYVNRLDMVNANGIKVLADCVKVLRESGKEGVIISAASIKTPRQVELAALAGADGCAIDYGVLQACGEHPVAQDSIRTFIADWEDLYGKGKRVYNL